jgi:hypothetical protein
VLIDTTCQTCLNKRTTNANNTCGCPPATFAAAAVRSKKAKACDNYNVISTNADCTNVIVAADVACAASRDSCAAIIGTSKPLEDTDFGTWNLWRKAKCMDDTDRTAAPTAAPYEAVKVSSKIEFNDTQVW